MIRVLERFPWTRLSDDRGDQQRITLVRPDGRSWIAYTHGTRLPGPYAADVYVALMALYRERRPIDGRLVIPFMELLRRMRATPGGTAYAAIEAAVDALVQLRIASVGIWTTTTTDATCIQLLRGQCHRHTVEVQLSPEVLARIAATRAVRPLDTRVYFRLPTPTARRLYRYLDYRRWAGTTPRSHFTINLRMLQQELPIDRQYPSHIKRTLDSAHQALVDAGVLEDVSYLPRAGRGNWSVSYRLPSLADVAGTAPVVQNLPAPRAAGSAEIRPVVEEILFALRDVQSTGFYVKTVKALGAEASRNLLGGVKQAMREGVSVELARKLFTATARRRAKDVGVQL